jgi:hypothetical protein
MALHDWRHRGQESNHDRPNGYLPTWSVILAVGFIVALLWALFSAYQGSNDRGVTNAPAGTPQSVQQPDTTPPTNSNPAQ